MKYLSVLVFAILLAWTWGLIHSEKAVSFETHAGIQEKLAQLILQTVQNKKPNATNVRVEKMWTEPQGEDHVLAHFVYSFQEPDTNGKSVASQIKGEGVLQKQVDDGSGLDRWSLKEFRTTGDAVVFEEGLMVTPGDEPATPESALTSPISSSESAAPAAATTEEVAPTPTPTPKPKPKAKPKPTVTPSETPAATEAAPVAPTETSTGAGQ